MATYRLKSKLYGELDNLSSNSSGNQKNGLSVGKALMIGATALGAYKAAGAGYLGRGASNAVNTFRVRTSAVGSNRHNKGYQNLLTNEAADKAAFTKWGNSQGFTQSQMNTGYANITKDYGNRLHGSSRIAAYAPQPTPNTTTTP